MTDKKKIQTPVYRLVELWRKQFLPFIIWCIAIYIVVAVYKNEHSYFGAEGVVELNEYIIAPLLEGTVQSISVDLYQEVKVGEVVGVIDNTIIKAQLETAEAELKKIKAELIAMTVDMSGGNLQGINTVRNLKMDEEESKIDYLDRLVEQEFDQVELQRLEILVKRYENLIKEKAIAESVYDEAKMQYNALKSKIDKNEEAIALAKKHYEQTESRRIALTEEGSSELEKLIAPYKESINVQEKIINELKEERKKLILRSPIEGKVTQVFCQTGQTVSAGTPILIVAYPTSTRIIAYLSENDISDIKEGTDVIVYGRHFPKKAINTKVLKVGATLEKLPLRIRPNPLLPNWGMTVLVGDVPPNAFLPGESVDVKFIKNI